MRASALLATAAVFAAVADARADSAIVLASDDATFGAALAESLVPAGMTVVPVADAQVPSLADITERSRVLADQRHATATVWVIATPRLTLVIYDRASERVLVRELPFGAPMTAAQAAEAARAARAMLRVSRAMPTDEAAITAPELHAAAPVLVRRRRLAALAGLGVRVGAGNADTALAGTLGAVWRPDALGVQLSATASPSGDFAAMPGQAGTPPGLGITGHTSDDLLALSVRLPRRIAPLVDLSASAGLAMHWIRVSGMVAQAPASDSRFDPAIQAGITATYAVHARFVVGVALSADYLLERQRYVLGGSDVLLVPRFQVSTGLVIGVHLL